MDLGIAKLGYIGSSFIDKLLDERAEREDLDVFVSSSGSKMDSSNYKKVISDLLSKDMDAYIIVSPNPSTTLPKGVIKELNKVNESVVIVGDYVGKTIAKELRENDIGYVFVVGDPLIGARKEFLDSTEMADFNADVLKVLSNTGVFRELVEEIDEWINSIKNKEDGVYLPQLVMDSMKVVRDEFDNPYAMAKARAALMIAELVAEKNEVACFELEEKEKYLPLVTSTHEALSKAARLAEEARDIQKTNDEVKRTPHNSDGSVSFKKKLFDSFK